MSENLCLAEASCASQIRTAKAVAEEIGSSAAARSGVSKWANISDGHSERDVQHVVAQQGSRLDVPISEMFHLCIVTYTYTTSINTSRLNQA